MRRQLAAALVAISLMACGSAATPPAERDGTITGHVLGYPCAPVERVGSPCSGRPMVGLAVEVTPAAGSAAPLRTVTGAGGTYTIAVAPGRYVVTVTGRAVGPASRTVDVTGGSTATADFVVDSGIR